MMGNTIVLWRMAFGRSYQELHLLMCFVSYSDTFSLMIPLLEGKKYFSISDWLKFPRLTSHPAGFDQIWKSIAISGKITSIVLDIAPKRDSKREALGTPLRQHSCPGKVGENGWKVYRFCDVELPNFLPQIQQEQHKNNSTDDICFLKKNVKTKHHFISWICPVTD